MGNNEVNINISDSQDICIGDISINASVGINADDKRELFLKLEEIVQSQGNKESMDVYNEFKHELAKEKPKNVILRSLWLGLTTMLPVLSQAADITSKVLKVIGR